MKLGLVTDPRFLLHDTGNHVENRTRLEAIAAALDRSGLRERTVPVAPRPASDGELLWLHSREMIQRIEEASAGGGAWLDPDTFASPESAGVARYAAGSVMELAGMVARGELDRGFAAVRPPGHHAVPTRPMGFCLYSNLALAARYCALRAGVERIFVFDWDVHHGNGTQDCLYQDGANCFFSFHQYPFYPGTGALDERGEGPGAGLTCNLPLPGGMKDADYLWAFDELVVPVAERYDPQLILVSAGYDAHRADPLGGMNLTTQGFRGLAQRISRLSRRTSARGKVVGVLEGGYHTSALADSVAATLEAWLAPEDPEIPEIRLGISEACRRVVVRARPAFGLE
ncbi:MAG: histone deacetylase [Armatimonadetes bacterium]|nr:histone deacetylase [Armatimonadota bacterium]